MERKLVDRLCSLAMVPGDQIRSAGAKLAVLTAATALCDDVSTLGNDGA